MFCALGLKVRERREPEERDDDDDGEEEKAMELNSQAFHFSLRTAYSRGY